jgi:3-hydroxyisobutyrate dehydrogenase-like beta-hydroxyacid dehydrogenase
VLVTKGDEDPAVVQRQPRLARAQGRGAADGPVVGTVLGAHGTARTAGRHVACGLQGVAECMAAWEGVALDAARPREVRWHGRRGRATLDNVSLFPCLNVKISKILNRSAQGGE